MDGFDLASPNEPFDPLGVVLFKALQAMAFLFFIALLAAAAKPKDGKVDTKAEFLISMDWPDDHPDDMDVFVQDPLGNVVWYRRRDAGFMTLERDDRGGANDFLLVHGRKVLTSTREELVSIRGIVAGEYTVNVYHFTAVTGRPVPVTVTVQKLNPTVTIVAKETVDVDRAGMEKTAVRFTIDRDGAVTGTSRVDRSILQGFYDARRNGG